MYDYDPQMLLPAPEENVSEKHLVSIPAMALIANNPPRKRPETMPYKIYWKARRNAKLALKARQQFGKHAAVYVDPETMDVVTHREKVMIDNGGRLPSIEVKGTPPKVWTRKMRKGLKLCWRR